MTALTVNELIAELQEVAKRGYGNTPVYGFNWNGTQLDSAERCPLTSVWDMSGTGVRLTIEPTEN